MNVLALCAGVGGIELGLRLSGWSRVVAYVEREAYVAACLRARMDEGLLDRAPIYSDLRSFDARPWRGKVDLVTGGWPCQPFSCAGKRKGFDDPRHLWPEFFRVLQECGAPLLFGENVRGHVSCGLRGVLEDLSRVGFDAEWDVFSAEEEGAPHRRERLFLLAYAPGFGSYARRVRVESEISGVDKFCAAGAMAYTDGDREQQPQRSEREEWGRTVYGSSWPAEPGVGRVAHGIPARVDRLRALGNAVLPRVAARAWEELIARAGE